MAIDLHLLGSIIADDLASHVWPEITLSEVRTVQLVTIAEDAIARGQALTPSQKETLLNLVGRQIDVLKVTRDLPPVETRSADYTSSLDLLGELRSWPTVDSIAIPGQELGPSRPALEQLEHLEHLRT